jgi:hypothetical protein
MNAALAGLLLLAAGAAAAQEVAPPETGMKQVEDEPADAGPSAAPDTGTEARPAPKPRAAMIAPLAATTTLLGIARAGERLVAVGQRGHILLSEDGKQWRQVPVPVNAMLNRVRFRDARQGWAVGHDATIVATADGGQTWTLQHFDPEARPLYDVIFLDDTLLSAIGGYGGYYDSPDSGRTWTRRTFPIGELGQHFNAAARLGDGTLLVAGERGLLMRSRDNAGTWELLSSPYTGSFFGALPAGEKGALVFGLRGNIYLAEDLARCPVVTDLEAYDPYTRETVSDPAALAKLGWLPLERPTTEGLFGGTGDGASAVLVGVNGVVVHVDLARKAASLLPPAPETLNDVVRSDGGWVAVGRRGAQHLGTLEAGAAGGED